MSENTIHELNRRDGQTGERVSLPIDDARTLRDALCAHIGHARFEGCTSIEEERNAAACLRHDARALMALLDAIAHAELLGDSDAPHSGCRAPRSLRPLIPPYSASETP